MPAPAPLVVPEFTRAVAEEVSTVARTLPFRPELGVDAERVFWVDVAGRERIGVAYAPATAHERAYWMIALANADGRRVSQTRLREVVRLVAGHNARYELAPPFDGAPQMTMARAPAE